MIGRLFCWLGYHDWNLAWRRVGEHQTCKRGCGAMALATDKGWVVRR